MLIRVITEGVMLFLLCFLQFVELLFVSGWWGWKRRGCWNLLILLAFLEKVWCLLFVGSLQVPLWWWKPSIPIMSWHWERQDTSDFLCAVFLSEGRERSWFCSGSDEKSPHKWRDQRFLLESFPWWYINGVMKKCWIIWSWGEIHKKVSNLIPCFVGEKNPHLPPWKSIKSTSNSWQFEVMLPPWCLYFTMFVREKGPNQWTILWFHGSDFFFPGRSRLVQFELGIS